MKKKKLAKRVILIFLAVIILCCGYMLYVHSISIRIFSDQLTFRPFSGKLFDVDLKDIDSFMIMNDVDEYFRDYYGLIDYHGRSWKLSPDQSSLERKKAGTALSKVVKALNDYRFYFYIPCDRDPDQIYDTPKWRKYGSRSLDPESDYISVPPFYRMISPDFTIRFSNHSDSATCYIRKNWIWVSEDWINYEDYLTEEPESLGWWLKVFFMRGVHEFHNDIVMPGAWYYGSSDLYDALMALE